MSGTSAAYSKLSGPNFTLEFTYWLMTILLYHLLPSTCVILPAIIKDFDRAATYVTYLSKGFQWHLVMGYVLACFCALIKRNFLLITIKRLEVLVIYFSKFPFYFKINMCWSLELVVNGPSPEQFVQFFYNWSLIHAIACIMRSWCTWKAGRVQRKHIHTG